MKYFIIIIMIKASTIVNKFHTIIYLYLIFGWLISLNSCKVLVGLSPTVMVQWGVNDNKCILTQLEKYLIKKEKKNIIQETSFTGDTLKKLNIIITPQQITFLSYLVLYHSFLQSYIRVLLLSE